MIPTIAPGVRAHADLTERAEAALAEREQADRQAAAEDKLDAWIRAEREFESHHGYSRRQAEEARIQAEEAAEAEGRPILRDLARPLGSHENPERFTGADWRPLTPGSQPPAAVKRSTSSDDPRVWKMIASYRASRRTSYTSRSVRDAADSYDAIGGEMNHGYILRAYRGGPGEMSRTCYGPVRIT